jgi:hypothetical protein
LERNPDLIELIDETSQEKQIAQQEYNNSELSNIGDLRSIDSIMSYDD